MEENIVKQLSPSTELYNLLVKKIPQATQEDLDGLVGIRKYFCEQGVMGVVSAVKGREVYMDPEMINIKKDSGEEYLWPLETSEKGKETVRQIVNFIEPDPSRGINLYESQPDRVGFPPDIIFAPNDRLLDDEIGPFLEEFKDPDKLQDLEALTYSIYSSVLYNLEPIESLRKNVVLSGRRAISPVFGKVLKEYGAVCIHIAALEYAILQLKGIDCQFVRSVGTNPPHNYLEVPFNGQVYVADPTWGALGTPDEVLSTLQARGLTTEYHEKYEPMRIRGIWSDKVSVR